MATKAQTEALKWLLERNRTSGIPSNALMVLYEQRSRSTSTTNRMHAWRRTSGKVLGRMKDAGLLEYDGWDRYTPRFKFTEAGFEAARAGLA